MDIGVNPVTGKRKLEVGSGFQTKQEVEEAATALIHEVNQATYLEETDQAFCEFANEWLKIYTDSKNIRLGMIRVRLHEISKLLPYFARLKLKDITRPGYQDALNDLKDLGYSDSTMSGVNRTGRMVIRKALELEMIKSDPIEFAYLQKDKKTMEQLEEEELPKYLEKEELALFLKTVKDHGLEFDYLMFLVLFYTGIHVGELVVLKWKDIDFVNHTISITKTYYNEKNNNTFQSQLLPPKTKRSRRWIIVDAEVINTLKSHKEAQNWVIERRWDAYYNRDFIFAKTKRQYGYPIVKTEWKGY